MEKNKNIILPDDTSLINPFINKIYLMKVQDCSYINLGGEDLIPPRDHILYMTFPKEWKTSDILQLFSPYGNIYIGWIDEGSAYIALDSVDNANKAYKAMKIGYNHTILTYAQYKALGSNKNDKLIVNAPKKILQGSNIQKSTLELNNRPKTQNSSASFITSPYVWRSQNANSSNQEPKKDTRKRKQNDEISVKTPKVGKKETKIKAAKPETSKVFLEDSTWE